jgi:hypothetical protein
MDSESMEWVAAISPFALRLALAMPSADHNQHFSCHVGCLCELLASFVDGETAGKFMRMYPTRRLKVIATRVCSILFHLI